MLYIYILLCVQIFSEYYNKRTQVRRLQWTYSLGNATVRGTFGNSKPRTFDFQVSILNFVCLRKLCLFVCFCLYQVVTLQAAVMLAFNTNDTWSFEALIGLEIHRHPYINSWIRIYTYTIGELKCPEEILKKVLNSLSCGKLRVLKKIPAEGNVIKNTDSFSFNDAFT